MSISNKPCKLNAMNDKLVAHLSVREKAIIIGLYLSKFDTLALNKMGFNGFNHAFNVLGYSIGVKPASIKNYRDEFDPYFPNNRKGWHKRTLRHYCKNIMDAFSDIAFTEFSDLIKSIIMPSYEIEEAISKAIKKDVSDSVAKRLATGTAAEEYFKANYHKENEFLGYELFDTRTLACGFDFKLSSPSDYYFIEVKGINQSIGNIVMTEKEHCVASKFQDRYCLFIVRNFIEKPNHLILFNPLHCSLDFKRQERRIVQVSFSATIR